MKREKQIIACKQLKLNKLAELEGKAILEIQKNIKRVNKTSYYALMTLKKLGWKKESEVLHDDIASDFYVEVIVRQTYMKHKYYKVIEHENAIYH